MLIMWCWYDIWFCIVDCIGVLCCFIFYYHCLYVGACILYNYLRSKREDTLRDGIVFYTTMMGTLKKLLSRKGPAVIIKILNPLCLWDTIRGTAHWTVHIAVRSGVGFRSYGNFRSWSVALVLISIQRWTVIRSLTGYRHSRYGVCSCTRPAEVLQVWHVSCKIGFNIPSFVIFPSWLLVSFQFMSRLVVICSHV